MATRTERRSTVIGVFEDRAHAVAAIKELYQAGFAEKNQIGIAGRHDECNTTVTEAYDVADHGSTAATGAVTGAVAGASLGGLVGLGAIPAIPVLGPVIAGGTLAVILVNAAGGAAIGAALGIATGETYPQDQREYYEREFEAGHTIVTVKAGSRSDDAVTILHRNGGYDLDRDASRPSTTTTTRETTVKSTRPPVSLPTPTRRPRARHPCISAPM